ncbi:hypothetical protein EDD11_006286 [Mortierella claussenii]|nr:hypothetical protein EDD11_006286 [Mortierella claussenii]
MLAYKETPVDTLLHQIPILIHLLQSNTTAAVEAVSASSEGGPSYIPNASHFTTAGPMISMAAAGSSFMASAVPDIDSLHNLSETDRFKLSPAMSALLALATFLERRGYRDPTNIPGYNYFWTVLHPILTKMEPVLQPVSHYLASYQTVAWMITVFHIWMATELLFYIHYWVRLAQAQLVDRVPKGPSSKYERRELFQRCLETIGEGAEAKRWVEIWFDTGRTAEPAKFEEIGRSNMMHWLAWAFWAAPIEEVFESPSGMMDLNHMVDSLESTKGIKFAEGHNPNVECIRLAFDPVVASHRPLIYYTLVWIANLLAGLVFHLLGFARFEGTLHPTHSYEQNGQQSINVDPSTDLTYWHRSPADPENKIPLVFIHGIGVGLVQYIHWVIALATISRPIILIEVPYVSNNLFKRDCMTPDDTYFAIERILKAHEYQKAIFMGHSLGTMLCAAVCRASSASSSKSILHGLILVDPICFLTHHSIARNFAYRVPATATDLIMDLFAAREVGTSWFIMRRFCWDQCIVFPVAWDRRHETALPLQGIFSPILPKMTRVFLSRNDALLDMGAIAEYLRTMVGLKEEKGELTVMEDMTHAQFLLRPSWFFKVLKAAQEC